MYFECIKADKEAIHSIMEIKPSFVEIVDGLFHVIKRIKRKTFSCKPKMIVTHEPIEINEALDIVNSFNEQFLIEEAFLDAVKMTDVSDVI